MWLVVDLSGRVCYLHLYLYWIYKQSQRFQNKHIKISLQRILRDFGEIALKKKSSATKRLFIFVDCCVLNTNLVVSAWILIIREFLNLRR